MKRLLTFVFFVADFLISFSQEEKLIDYPLPDTVRAVSFLADISVSPITGSKEIFAGIQTDIVKLSLEADKREREIVFLNFHQAPRWWPKVSVQNRKKTN